MKGGIRTNKYLLLVTCLFFAGCNSSRSYKLDSPPEKPSLKDETQKTEDISKGLQGVSESIEASTTSIDASVDAVRSDPSVSPSDSVQSNLDNIANETDSLKDTNTDVKLLKGRVEDLSRNLTAEQQKVDQWNDYAQKAESENADLQNRIRDLEDENQRQFKQMMAWIGVVCVAGIGICIVLAIWTRSRIATAVAAGFGITLVVSIAISMYLEAIALITVIVLGVLFLGVVAYLGWEFFISKKTEEELVHTGEVAKQYLSLEAREKLFGYGAEPGKVDQIQSATTKNKVRQIREINRKKKKGKLTPSVPEFYRTNGDSVPESYLQENASGDIV